MAAIFVYSTILCNFAPKFLFRDFIDLDYHSYFNINIYQIHMMNKSFKSAILRIWGG